MGLQDSYNRSIRYLRLSVTGACPMRCMYCRQATAPPVEQVALGPDEMAELVRHLVQQHGLQKVRLTGGEPTARADLLQIIARLRVISGMRELVMTTNGLTLARQAGALANAGLDRVNISLDSLRADRFQRMTGVSGAVRVLAGIHAAVGAGLTPVRLNCVVCRGENDKELADLLLFAAGRGLELRFIELMPMGPLASRWTERYVPESEMRQTLTTVVGHWSLLASGGGPARRYRVAMRDGCSATVGFITPMSAPFCSECDRIRIGSDGTFYPCLMDSPAVNLMPAIRPALDPRRLDRLLREGLSRRAAVHPVSGRTAMVQIGG
jgi:cyclic pyranopterin phosphate synthase